MRMYDILYVHLYVYLYTNVHKNTHMYSFVQRVPPDRALTQLCTSMMHKWISMCSNVYVNVYVYVCVYVCVYVYVHAASITHTRTARTP